MVCDSSNNHPVDCSNPWPPRTSSCRSSRSYPSVRGSCCRALHQELSQQPRLPPSTPLLAVPPPACGDPRLLLQPRQAQHPL